ncbi:MAG TPA: (2Fe-2S)-binding protein [Methylovorus sp.]|jgi:NAD(P)H-nitrite reductase large subunit|nr:(2Fe-2S)-binding protein [Methylovorus sp.]
MTTDKDNPDNEVLCHCSGTKRGQIRALFLEGRDLEGISRWTGALSGCGGCEWDIEWYLKELQEEAATSAAATSTDSAESAAPDGADTPSAES